MKKIGILAFSLFTMLNAQVKISDRESANEEVNPNAILEVESDNKAVLLPNLSNEALGQFQSPQKGMIAFSTDENSLVVFTGEKWVKFTEQEVPINVNPVDPPTPTPETKKFIINSYIRPELYEERGRIDKGKLLANNDLIYFGATPYWTGELMYEIPDNTIKNPNQVEFLESYEDKNGVVSFAGTSESYANVGREILNGSKNGAKKFSFGTWIYIEEWRPNAEIFGGYHWDEKSLVSLGMGEDSKFIFKVQNSNISIRAENLVGEWHHIALTYNGGTVKFYIDGEEVKDKTLSGDFPEELPFMKRFVQIGKNFKGKLDETFFNHLSLTQGNIKNFMRGIELRETNWASTKTIAYWKYDDESNRGKDEQSWKFIAKDIREILEKSNKNIKLRLGLNTGGNDVWKGMMGKQERREKFAGEVAKLIKEGGWDGVDFDFEWCETSDDYANYSATIIAVKEKLKELGLENKIFSVSLHPVSYEIS